MPQYKTDRIQNEFTQLMTMNRALYDLVGMLETFVRLEFKKPLMLTEIYRSKEENDALYAQTPPGLRPAGSPHCQWAAVDLRSTLYTEAEIKRLLAFANTLHYKDGVRPVAIYHTIRGNAPHFHIQYVAHS